MSPAGATGVMICCDGAAALRGRLGAPNFSTPAFSFRYTDRPCLQSRCPAIRHGDIAVVDLHAVGEAAERLEQVRIRFISAQSQSGRDVQRHLVAAMRDAAFRRPSMLRSE